jgi:hypothetical protein
MASEVFGCVVDLLAYSEMLSGYPVVLLRCWTIFVVLVVSAREEGWLAQCGYYRQLLLYV